MSTSSSEPGGSKIGALRSGDFLFAEMRPYF